jgi:phosphoribosylformimino-5-aminoimidazole carboxamide ribotide isomerase
VKGEFSTASKVAEDAVATARSFEASGAKWLHMVDLDGALAGQPVNDELIARTAAATKMKTEVGGGVRAMKDIESYLSRGIARVILGSVAVRRPALVREAVQNYGDAIAVGVDAEGGVVKASGWTESSDANYLDHAEAMANVGVSTIIYTDIARDGTLEGPNLEHLKKLKERLGSTVNITASGGIRNETDIQDLAAAGLYGAICGKSIYAGTLDLSAALKIGQAGAR